MKKILVMALVMMLGASGAWALGTDANTSISNTATLDFSAGGASQPSITSTTDTFVVDRKIDMMLATTDTDQQPGTMGQTNVKTHFQFKNEGNDAQRFKLTVKDMSNGGHAEYNNKDDDQNVAAFTEISCTDTHSNTVSVANPGSLYIDAPEDENYTCTVSATIPSSGAGVIDGQIMNIELNATAVDSSNNKLVQNTGVDNPAQVDIVFADGVSNPAQLGENQGAIDTAKNGEDIARSGYIIKTPVLDATKLSCVYSDPVNGVNTNAKRIPGATIVYVFDINNTGTADATDVNLSDTFVGELDLTNTAGTISVDANSTNTPCKCDYGAAKGGNSGDSATTTNTVSGQVVTVKSIPITHQSHTCVTLEAVIK